MKQETFRCPHCGTSLTKSAAAWVLGEVGFKPPKGANPLPENVVCPGCGGGIPTMAMVEGRLDDMPRWVEGVSWTFFVAAGVVLTALLTDRWHNFFLGALCGFAVAFGAMLLVMYLIETARQALTRRKGP